MQIFEQLENVEPANKNGNLMQQAFLFLLNKIPIGKRKAPKSVHVEDGFTKES